MYFLRFWCNHLWCGTYQFRNPLTFTSLWRTSNYCWEWMSKTQCHVRSKTISAQTLNVVERVLSDVICIIQLLVSVKSIYILNDQMLSQTLHQLASMGILLESLNTTPFTNWCIFMEYEKGNITVKLQKNTDICTKHQSKTNGHTKVGLVVTWSALTMRLG